MTEQQFLEKYGHEKVWFSRMYKYRVNYENEKLNIWCSGVAAPRDDINREETVLTVFDYDDFEFGFIHENDDLIQQSIQLL